jgi:hypothetical protein
VRGGIGEESQRLWRKLRHGEEQVVRADAALGDVLLYLPDDLLAELELPVLAILWVALDEKAAAVGWKRRGNSTATRLTATRPVPKSRSLGRSSVSSPQRMPLSMPTSTSSFIVSEPTASVTGHTTKTEKPPARELAASLPRAYARSRTLRSADRAAKIPKVW